MQNINFISTMIFNSICEFIEEIKLGLKFNFWILDFGKEVELLQSLIS
jgi:hypothetical protein